MERIVKRFKSPRHLQRFVSIHDPIANLFHFPRHSLNAADCAPLTEAELSGLAKGNEGRALAAARKREAKVARV